MATGSPALPPGFRFHPTDEELILHYLLKRTAAPYSPASIIPDVDIYKFNPWELPDKAKFGDREWYYFSPRDRKYPNGVRPNRAAASGYWKATGTDKPITASIGKKESIGVKKALVFYKGKPPKGVKTSWIMHEYRLLDLNRSNESRAMKHREDSMRLDDWVLCRIYQKTNHQQLLCDREQAVLVVEESVEKNSTRYSKMHRSISLSELLLVEEADFSLLSRLIETPLNCAIPDQAPFFSPTTNSIHPFKKNISNTNTILIEHEGDNSKRQRVATNYYFDDCRSHMSSPVKQLNTSTSIYDQLVNQYDFSQPFYYEPPMPNFPFGKP